MRLTLLGCATHLDSVGDLLFGANLSKAHTSVVHAAMCKIDIRTRV